MGMNDSYSVLKEKGERCMRSLTIRRNKSFVGCLMKAKVYVEDLLLGDTTIGQTRCRKLGELKNGEEKSFQVTEDYAKIYVIVDQVSRNYCNEFYQLEPGTEPVILSGGFKLNPGTGNAFQFDNNTNAVALENRKRNGKRGSWIIVLAAVIGVLVGLANTGVFKGDPEPKVFTKAGMSVTLTDAFEELEAEGFDVAYDSDQVAVLALKETYASVPDAEDLPVEEYAGYVMEANGQYEELKIDGNLVYFEYSAEGDRNIDYHYTVFLFKGPDAFWIVQFATYEGKAEANRGQIMDWAKTVTFLGE